MPGRFPIISSEKINTPEAVVAFRLARRGISAAFLRGRFCLTWRHAAAVVTARAAHDPALVKSVAAELGLSPRSLTRPLSAPERETWRFHLVFHAGAADIWRAVACLLQDRDIDTSHAARHVGLKRSHLADALTGRRRLVIDRKQAARLAALLGLGTEEALVRLRTDPAKPTDVAIAKHPADRRRALEAQPALAERFQAAHAARHIPAARTVARMLGLPPVIMARYLAAKRPHRLKELPSRGDIRRLARYLADQAGP